MADPASTGGFGSGLESILANPLTQAALSGYLSYVGTPRYMGRGGALASGGLGALSGFNQAEQTKLQAPLQHAQAQEAQARVPYMQSQSQLAGLQAQQLQKQMQPISPQLKQAIEAYKQSATDPQEKSYIDILEKQAMSGAITGDDLAKYLESYDEAKRLRELYQGQLYQQQQGLVSGIAGMLPGMAGLSMGVAPGMSATLTPPGSGGPPNAGAPSAPASPSLGGVPPPDLPFKPSHTVPMADGSTAFYNDADKHWYAKGPSGWQALP